MKVIMRKIILKILFLSFLFTLPVSAGDSAGAAISLSEAIKTAVENNFSVREASENHKSSIQEKKSALADMFAKTSANYSFTSLHKGPVMKTMPVETQVADRTQYHWDITLIQPLFTGFALKTRYDMTGLGVRIKELEKEQAILDVTQKVKSSYFNVLLTRKMLQVTDDAVKSLEAHESDAQKYYNEGLIPYNDLLRAKVALADVVQNWEKVNAGVNMSISHLNMLMGVDINKETEIIDNVVINPSKYKLDTLINEAMKNRPVIKALGLGLKTLEKVIKIEQSAYYPETALVGRYEQNGNNPEVTENDFNNVVNANLTIQAKWIFFEWGKVRYRILKARHDKQAMIEKIKGIEEGIKLEIKNAFLNLNVAEKNIKTAEQSLGQAKENWRITNLQFNQQIATTTEVLDARTFLNQADTNYYKSLYGYLISLSELERAVGKNQNRS